MLVEISLLLGFVGTIGITAYKAWQLMKTDRIYLGWSETAFSFFGLVFFFGLLFLSYMFSFSSETTIAGTSETFSVSNNEYLFLNWLVYAASFIFLIGIALCVIEYAIFLSKIMYVKEGTEEDYK